MEEDNKRLKQDMEENENAAEKVQNEAKEMERRQKQLERVMGDATYKQKNTESELNEALGLFEGERRKSMGIETTAAQLQKEHKRLTEELE
jgi:hypothetical protein